MVGVDVPPARDDHLLPPAKDEEVAALAKVAGVAVVQPAPPPHLRGGHVVLVVLAVPSGVAGDDLTDLANRAGHPGVVDDADLDRLPRPAHRPQPATRALRVHPDTRFTPPPHPLAVPPRRLAHPL